MGYLFILKIIKQMKYIRRIPLILALIITGAGVNALGQSWVEDSFEDFVDGTLDASGNNIYVSHDGKIRTINRFDLNDDGWIDLLFPHTHDRKNIIKPTLAEISSDRTIQTSRLEIDGSKQVEAADLNKDGWLDLVFCPSRSGLQYPRRFVSIIYGGEDGWPASRSNGLLPVHGVEAIALADLNDDSWVDIVTLNAKGWLHGQPDGKIMRVFWGGERGYILTRYQDVGVENAIALDSGDFDGDGAADVAFLRSDNSIEIFWSTAANKNEVNAKSSKVVIPGSFHQSINVADSNNDDLPDLIIGSGSDEIIIVPGKRGRAWKAPIEITGFSASHVAAEDLDGDNYVDLVLSYFKLRFAGGGEDAGAAKESVDVTNILWGDKKGFSASRSTSLDAPKQKTSAIGDFDRDGIPDIAIAIHQGASDYLTTSIIYYGKGGREFELGDNKISTEGTFSVLSVPQSEGKPSALIFSNSVGGSVKEEVPAFLYWGGPHGFSTERLLKIPLRSGYEASAADLNADGHTDVILLDELHAGGEASDDPYAGVNIYWGSSEGIELEGRTNLTESYLGSSTIADINKDGYLDMVLGQFTESNENPESHVIIYYGGKDGFDRSRRVTIPCDYWSLAIQLADYDKDGWLDIAANSSQEGGVNIFYGSADGYDVNRSIKIDAPSVVDLDTADLNNDGWLDIVACCYRDFVNVHNDIGSLIFWGGEKGFKQWNSQWLPGFTPLGPVIADWDSDGFLDLFFPFYHGDISREEQPCYLFWGSAEGYSKRGRTHLFNDSGSDGLAADFNKDGLLDLAVANHTIDGNHNTASKIFLNDGNRFAKPHIDTVPTHGPHWMYNSDMGHIYDRSWRQIYKSSIFSYDDQATKGMLSYAADIPEGTQLKFVIRSGSEKDKLKDSPWQSVESGEFKLSETDRFFQYKATFISDNGDRFPMLDRVNIKVM
jgi:hypothetical protein